MSTGRVKPNYIYAIISVALVLFIIGLFGVITLHARKLVVLFKEKVDVWIELKPNTGQADVTRLIGQVRNQPFVKKETVTFITKEQAIAQIKEELGDDGLVGDIPNMMRDIVRFNVESQFMNLDSLSRWREAMRQDTVVADLFFEEAATHNVGRNIEKLGWLVLGIGFLLIFAAVSLIHNTIRLALYSNRFIIKNQELVGASWEFISKPYIRRGIWNGFLSALVAISGLLLLVVWLQRRMPEIKELEDTNGMALLFLGLLVLGVLISGLSSHFTIKKFLRMRLDDLY